MENPSYYAIIPSFVRYSKNVEPSAKLLYGEITALTNKEGYCWASNAYFAELYGVCERTIGNWLSSLERENFVKIDTTKEGMKWDRKIWIIQNNFTKGKNLPDRTENNFQIDRKKTATEVIHSNNTKEQQQVAAVFFECLKDEKIEESEKVWLSQNYDEPTIKHALLFAHHPSTKITKGIAQCLKWACKTKPAIPKGDAEVIEKNKQEAEKILEKSAIPSTCYFEVLNKEVEIGYCAGQAAPTVIEYIKDGFSELLKMSLNKYQIKYST